MGSFVTHMAEQILSLNFCLIYLQMQIHTGGGDRELFVNSPPTVTDTYTVCIHVC